MHTGRPRELPGSRALLGPPAGSNREHRNARPSLGPGWGKRGSGAGQTVLPGVAALGRPLPGSWRRRQVGSGPGAPGAHSCLEPGPEGGRRLPRRRLSLSPNSAVSERAAGPGCPAGCHPGGGGGEAGLRAAPSPRGPAAGGRPRPRPSRRRAGPGRRPRPAGRGARRRRRADGPAGLGPYLRLCTSSRRDWLPGRPLGWTSWCLCRLWCTRMNEEAAAAAAGAAPRGDETPRAQPRRRRQWGGDQPGPGGGGRGGGGGPGGGDGSRGGGGGSNNHHKLRRPPEDGARGGFTEARKALAPAPGLAAAPQPRLVPPSRPHGPLPSQLASPSHRR